MTDINGCFYVIWESHPASAEITAEDAVKEDVWMGPFKSREDAARYIGRFSGILNHGKDAMGSDHYKVVEFSRP